MDALGVPSKFSNNTRMAHLEQLIAKSCVGLGRPLTLPRPKLPRPSKSITPL
jgi:hypothetical protein